MKKQIILAFLCPLFIQTMEKDVAPKELHPQLQDHVDSCVDKLYFNPDSLPPVVLLGTENEARQQVELFARAVTKRLEDPALIKKGYKVDMPKECEIVSGKTRNQFAQNLFNMVARNTPDKAHAPREYVLGKAIITFRNYQVENLLDPTNLSVAEPFALRRQFPDWCQEDDPVVPALHPYDEIFKTDSHTVSWYYKNEQQYWHPCFLPFIPFYLIQDWWNKYYRKHTASFHRIPLFYDSFGIDHAVMCAHANREKNNIKIIDLNFKEELPETSQASPRSSRYDKGKDKLAI